MNSAKDRVREQLKEYPLFLSRKDVAEILGVDYRIIPSIIKENKIKVVGTPNKFKVSKEVFIDFVAGESGE